jgi:hypothetical protein
VFVSLHDDGVAIMMDGVMDTYGTSIPYIHTYRTVHPYTRRIITQEVQNIGTGWRRKMTVLSNAPTNSYVKTCRQLGGSLGAVAAKNLQAFHWAN